MSSEGPAVAAVSSLHQQGELLLNDLTSCGCACQVGQKLQDRIYHVSQMRSDFILFRIVHSEFLLPGQSAKLNKVCFYLQQVFFFSFTSHVAELLPGNLISWHHPAADFYEHLERSVVCLSRLFSGKAHRVCSSPLGHKGQKRWFFTEDTETRGCKSRGHHPQVGVCSCCIKDEAVWGSRQEATFTFQDV